MSETRYETGYDRPEDDDTNRAIRRHAAGQPVRDPEPDWQLTEQTKAIGQEGLAQTQEASAAIHAKRDAETRRKALIAETHSKLKKHSSENHPPITPPHEKRIELTHHVRELAGQKRNDPSPAEIRKQFASSELMQAREKLAEVRRRQKAQEQDRNNHPKS